MTPSVSPDSVLFISYRRPKVGRELAALELIAALAALLEKHQAAGVVHSVEAVSLTPVGGELGGFLMVRGGEAAIEELRLSEELTELMLRGNLFLDDFSVIDGVAGERQRAWLGRMASLFVRKDGLDVIK